jgi:mRNA interferase MazF
LVTPLQGEIWWAQATDKRRPVLIVTRSEAVPILNDVIVAVITKTIRNIPTEIRLGAEHGLSIECVAQFDNLQPIRRGLLTSRIGSLGPSAESEICRALSAFADC